MGRKPNTAGRFSIRTLSLMILVEESRIQALVEKGEIPERTRSRLKPNLELQRSNLVTKNARSGMQEFVTGI